jgi:hypothetical protein
MSENSNRKTTGQYPLHTGSEAEQYSFYRVPAVMFSDPELKKLSAEAKLLYGLLLDRMGLSIKNEWLDKENHVYIYYTVDEIKDALGCGNKKAGALLAELDDKKGIGLITRVRQGLGRPDRIYVRKCVRVEHDPEGIEMKPEVDQEEIPGGHPQTCQNDTQIRLIRVIINRIKLSQSNLIRIKVNPRPWNRATAGFYVSTMRCEDGWQKSTRTWID